MSRVNTKNALDPTSNLVGPEIVIFSGNAATHSSRHIVSDHKTASLSKVKLSRRYINLKTCIKPKKTLLGDDISLYFQKI